MQKIKYIIWDWNGTLVNDAWLFVELMNEELIQRNLPQINVEKYREQFTFPVKKYYKNLGFDFEKEDFKTVGLHFIQNFKKRNQEPHLFLNALDVLKKIHSRGVGQSVVSAQENNLLNETIKFYQLENFFDYIAGIDHVYADNKIKLAKSVRKKIRVDDKNMLLIGDSIHDYEVAQALNIECILFSNGHYSKKRLISCDCEIVDDHTELLSFIESRI